MTVKWSEHRAVLFDLDGVITPTAEVHMHAWSTMFSEYLAKRGIAEPYTDQDYFDYVDGKPRYDGVRSFLASRGIHLPEGTPEDLPDLETVCGLGNRKDALFGELLARDGVTAYPGSVRLLDHLRGLAIPMAIVSSSRNALDVLAAADVTDYFASVIHGGIRAQRGLAGKPAPDMFEEAARELGVPDADSVVVEDALSGIAAGAAGDFALVVGVDRGAGEEALREAGADLVVTDLEELL